MAMNRTFLVLFSVLALLQVSAEPAESACFDGSATCLTPVAAQSESEIEAAEAAEASALELQLLQTKVSVSAESISRLPAASLVAGSDAEAKQSALPPRVPEVLASAWDMHAAAMSPQTLQGAIPVAAIFIGFILTRSEQSRTLGLLSVYFGVQTGLNLYMKIVLSNTWISKERGMKGIPGAFLITALQQLVSFCLLIPVLVILWPTRWRYTPKPLKTPKAWAGVLGLSVTFALNIGLNNMSLSLLPMSINLMIRSCIPLATWVMQKLVSVCVPGGFGGNSSTPMEVGLMLSGVFFAALAAVAKEEGASHSHSGGDPDSKDFVAGIVIGVLSLVACSLYLIFAQWLGQDVKMNPIDMTLYMSVPAALFLLPLMSMHHPVGWKGFHMISDWQVLHEVMSLSPHTMILVAFSGFFAVCYNTLQYAMVSELSATHTAFAGNFNKAATIVLSLVLGLETLPGKPWGQVTVFSIVGGVASFTAYSLMKTAGGGKAGH